MLVRTRTTVCSKAMGINKESREGYFLERCDYRMARFTNSIEWQDSQTV